MLNASQLISLKMGNKFVFREPLQSLKSYSNKNFQGNNNNFNIYKPNNFYSPNNNNIKKRNYEGMDIIPKFIANENMKEINGELLNRLLTKKSIFIKLMKTFFSEQEDYFSNSIQEVEMEMYNNKDILENNKNRDYEGFIDLLSFINCNRTNANLTTMQNISLDDYKNMDYDQKRIILGGIFENKKLFYQKLNLKNYQINNNHQRSNSNLNKKHIYNINKNNFNDNSFNNNRLSLQNQISKDQIELFKEFIGNPHISDNHVISYFDSSYPKVIIAANKYYKNIYGTDHITLYYYYPTKGQAGTKIHKFRFTEEIAKLFSAAQDDYMSVVSPRLFMENGREIKNDRRTKCIGALNLSNNAKIKVLY